MMYGPAVRERLGRLIRERDLTRADARRPWTGKRGARPGMACLTIATTDVELEVDLDRTGLRTRFHSPCHVAWREVYDELESGWLDTGMVSA